MWARRSNFAQAVERAACYSGEEMNGVDWDLRDPHYACSFVYLGNTTYAAHHLVPMTWNEIDEFHEAQLAARAARNVPFACPDLDQEFEP